MSKKSPEPKSLGDVLRENASQRPAFSKSPIEWELVAGGIKPRRPVLVDCAVNAREFDEICNNKPQWVIETYDGHTPTCLEHSGKILNSLLQKASDHSEVAMYLHPYKGE